MLSMPKRIQSLRISCYGFEALPPPREEIFARPQLEVSRDGETRSLKPLKPMTKHRPVVLLKDGGANLDGVVRSDAYEKTVKCDVMKRAEGDSVIHDRVATWFPMTLSRCSGSVPRYLYARRPSSPNPSSYGPAGAVVMERGMLGRTPAA